jgi:hypothetical protein
MTYLEQALDKGYATLSGKRTKQHNNNLRWNKKIAEW